jgi:ParB family chromosome partitioning protein
MIIAGERRWRAARDAGLTTVPAIVKNYSEQQIKEISLIENLQREDLNPVEAARAMKQLMTDYNFTQEQVADRIGKQRSSVANTLRLLNLREEVLEMIIRGKLSSGHAKCLVVVQDPGLQLKLALAGADNRVSVREFEKMVSSVTNPKPATNKKTASPELEELISDMRRVFATKVTALGNDKRGRIYIDYYSRDDLDRIYELIEGLK